MITIVIAIVGRALRPGAPFLSKWRVELSVQGAAFGVHPIIPRRLDVIDLTHYLDARGAIAPERGPARKLADFVTAVVVQASDLERADSVPGPLCFGRCTQDRPAVEAALTEDDPMIWRCTACRTEGQVSHWQGTFWDLSLGPPSEGAAHPSRGT
jgi:hypothetical protein